MHNYLTNKDSNKNAKNNDPNANKSKVQSQDTSYSSMKNLSQTTEVKIKEENQEQQTSEPARADVSSNAACSNPQKKAKILRLERKLNKLKSKEEIVVLPKPSANENLPKTLEDYLLEEPTPIHNLVVKLVSSSSSEFKESLLETHKLYVKYQMMVHEDKEEECTIEQFKRFLVKTPLQVIILLDLHSNSFCINNPFSFIVLLSRVVNILMIKLIQVMEVSISSIGWMGS